MKLYEALDEIPHLDDACFERGCMGIDNFAKEKK
jgi:hypothetical protein